MNRGLKIRKLTDGQVSQATHREATMKILANAQSKSVAVAAITQTHAHATPTHLLSQRASPRKRAKFTLRGASPLY